MKPFLISILLLLSLSVFAQQTPDAVADSFFFYFKHNGVERSLQYVFATNKYLKQNPDIVNTLKAKFDKALPIIGEFYSYDKYLQKQVSNSFVQLGYLMLFDRQPIKIVFNLYNHGDHWQIQDLRFDDKLDDVINMLPNKVE
jgi:hypothetical protein